MGVSDVVTMSFYGDANAATSQRRQFPTRRVVNRLNDATNHARSNYQLTKIGKYVLGRNPHLEQLTIEGNHIKILRSVCDCAETASIE